MTKSTSPILLLILPILMLFSGCVTEVHEAESEAPAELGSPASAEETTTVDLMEGKEWKYEDSGEDLGSAWREIDFDDAGWDSGPAPLGYGDDDIATELEFGLNDKEKHITSYFRMEFEIAVNKDVTEMRANLRCDDAAIIYMNGQEVIRKNLPEDEVGYKTHAVEIISGEQEKEYHDYAMDSGTVKTGRNVLAVEMHQRGPTSSDLIFDLKIAVDSKTKPKPPRPQPGGRKAGPKVFKRSRF